MKRSGFPRCAPSASLAFALACFLLGPALPGQRLPSTVVPEHYELTLTPDLKDATFSGVESIDITPEKSLRDHHPQLCRDRLPIC